MDLSDSSEDSEAKDTNFSWEGFWTSRPDNFDAHEVFPHVWLGSVDATDDVTHLTTRNIQYIVTVGADMEPQHACIDYVVCPCDDAPHTNLVPCFDLLHVLVDRAVEEECGVLVHCAAGISRSTTTVLSWLIARKGMSLRDALWSVREKRAFVAPNGGFMAQLSAWEAKGSDLEEFLAKPCPPVYHVRGQEKILLTCVSDVPLSKKAIASKD